MVRGQYLNKMASEALLVLMSAYVAVGVTATTMMFLGFADKDEVLLHSMLFLAFIAGCVTIGNFTAGSFLFSKSRYRTGLWVVVAALLIPAVEAFPYRADAGAFIKVLGLAYLVPVVVALPLGAVCASLLRRWLKSGDKNGPINWNAAGNVGLLFCGLLTVGIASPSCYGWPVAVGLGVACLSGAAFILLHRRSYL